MSLRSCSSAFLIVLGMTVTAIFNPINVRAQGPGFSSGGPFRYFDTSEPLNPTWGVDLPGGPQNLLGHAPPLIPFTNTTFTNNSPTVGLNDLAITDVPGQVGNCPGNGQILAFNGLTDTIG